MATTNDIRAVLLDGLRPRQQDAVRSDYRRLLVVAGAGSGKTEVMARRVVWWVKVDDVARDAIVAFTFTERAAEEMKFRIRAKLDLVTPPDEDATLGNMYVGTIHGFCLKWLRELAPDDYHNYDIVDDVARLALVQRGFHGILGLSQLQGALAVGQYECIERFLHAYDLLNEYGELDVELPAATPPHDLREESDWCKAARLRTRVGSGPEALAFAAAAARFYAYLRCRRFLDFSTSQAEFVRLLEREPSALADVRERITHVVVDEVQDINPIQDRLVCLLVGGQGGLTAVGDHRQVDGRTPSEPFGRCQVRTCSTGARVGTMLIQRMSRSSSFKTDRPRVTGSRPVSRSWFSRRQEPGLLTTPTTGRGVSRTRTSRSCSGLQRMPART